MKKIKIRIWTGIPNTNKKTKPKFASLQVHIYKELQIWVRKSTIYKNENQNKNLDRTS